MSQKRVDVANLELGMYVSELDRPWLETSFLFQGFPILGQEELEELRRCCDYVYVDDEMGVALQPERVSTAPKSRPVKRFATHKVNIASSAGKQRPIRNRVKFEQELPRAREVYHQAHDYINTIFSQIRIDRSIPLDQARQLTEHTVESITNNENAMLWLTLLKQKDEYTTYHSINVCVLSVLFGRHLGLSEVELKILGLGALLHDIGKMRVPAGILNKNGRLTPEEELMMRQHPLLGDRMLATRRGVPGQIREIVRSHHERVDGSGYPQGLEGDELGLMPMIVSIVDVYDAMTSDRAYHERISPHEALNMMYSWAATHFREELLEAFIRCLGIYPVGSLVELSSGEVALVLTVNRVHHLLPQVLLLLNRDKHPYDIPKLLNLELQRHSGVPIAITKILPSNAYGIDVRKFAAEFATGYPAR
ncbi:MAG: HD-GYP domain-containing protein [Gammaproteobacteria bacterium]|nr:HD-GYP domain-containing protein [Gammaproteobacteria bacterium]